MKKSEMKAKAEGILAKITKFEEEYKKLEHLLDSNTAQRINIQQIKVYKESVNNNYLKRIDNLVSEDPPPLPESPGAYSFDDPNAEILNRQADEYQRVFNTRLQYTRIPQNLNGIEREVNNLMKHLEPVKTSISGLSPTLIELVPKKAQYIELSESIQINIDQDTQKFASISSALLADPQLKESLKKVQLQQAGYRNLLEILKKDTVKAGVDERKQLAAYDNGLQLLEAYQDGYNQSTDEVRNRMKVLTSAENVYEEVVLAKNTAVDSAKRAMSSTNFLLKHEDLKSAKKLIASSEASISEINSLIKKIADKAQEMEKTDYMAKAGSIKPTPQPLDQINAASSRCAQDKSELTQMVDTLNKKVAEFNQQIDEAAKKVKTDVVEQQQKFNEIAGAIKEKLTVEKVDAFAIRKLEIKFEREVARLPSNGQNSIAFDQEKLANLKEITEELTKQVLVEENRILQRLGENINIIRDDVNLRQKQILATVDKSGFKFNPTERESVAAVRDYKFTLNAGTEKNIEALSDKLKHAHGEKVGFDELYGELDDIVVIHKAAKPIAGIISAKSFNAQGLAHAVNESPHGSKLLTAIGQYSEGLTEVLNNNLALFDIKGIAAIKAFVKYSEERLNTSISEKTPLSLQQRLALITFLSEANVDYIPFLDQTRKNKDITAAVFYLKEQKLPGLITAENLGNKPFIDALLVLKEHKINLSQEATESLAKDANKCKLICQQNDLYKISQQRITEDTSEVDRRVISNQMTEDVFAALIKDVLKIDKNEVTAALQVAVSMVKEHAPQYNQHWLLVMVKESEPLQGLLNNEQSVKNNLPFLKIIFDDAVAHKHYLPDYFTEKKPNQEYDPHAYAVGRINDTLNRNNLLEQIISANGIQKSTFSVEKMAVVMEEINKFVTEYNAGDQNIRNSLSRFRREAVPILLNPDLKPNDKKEHLEELADKHFKNTGIIDRLLECIFNAFEKISPKIAEKISEYRSSFFSTQKVAALNHLQKGFEPQDEESTADMEENEPLIPKGGMNT